MISCSMEGILDYSLAPTIDLGNIRCGKMSAFGHLVPMLQRFVLRLIQFIATKILGIWYSGETQRIPTTKSSVLMESASSLACRIRNGKVTSTEVVQTFIDRIQEVNGILNCVVDNRYGKALEEAEKVDKLIASGIKTVDELEKETPFLGVPFTTKDSIAVSGLLHAAGIRARKDIKAEKDSDVVAAMKRAGGIPIALTNVSELCYWWESNNPIFGKTKNPYDTNRTAGGSSGGEACLITACGSPIGIGSDLGGSIRVPSAFNGIFGHKPSADVTPLGGLFPPPTTKRVSFNTVGPMSRFSVDLLPALKVMTADCSADLKLDEPVDLKNLKYYYVDDFEGYLLSQVDPEIKEAVVQACEHLKRTYRVSARKLNMPSLKCIYEMWNAKMTMGCEPQTSKLLTNNEGKVNVPREMLKAILGTSQHTMATLLMAFLEESGASSKGVQQKLYWNMFNHLRTDLEELLGTDGILICPTQPNAACHHYGTLFKPFDIAYTAIFNTLGLPSTQCPMGLNEEGLPIGIQIVGGKYQDRLTIAVAQDLDEAFGGWRPSPTKGTLVLKNRELIESKNK